MFLTHGFSRIQSGSKAACVQVESEHSIFVENLKNESVGQSDTCQASSGHVTHVWTAHTAAHLPHTWCSRPGQTIFEMELGTELQKMLVNLTYKPKLEVLNHKSNKKYAKNNGN